MSSARTAASALSAVAALASLTACAGSSSHAARSSSVPAGVGQRPLAGTFHRPSGPGDAAVEYVTGLASGRRDLSDPLACTGLDYGALPLVFEPAGHSERWTVTASRITAIAPSRWRVTLVRMSDAGDAKPYTTATVIRTGTRYEVCRVH